MTHIGLAVTAVAVLLVACAQDDNDDLRQWMRDETRDFKGRIQPLPRVKPYEPVPYDATGIVDPFKPSKIKQESSKGGGVQPDVARPKEPLEAYPLESLVFVGVLSRAGRMFGIVQADGTLHQVRVGNYMGQNFGVVTKVSDAEIVLRELVQDPAGDWVERTSKLLLQTKEGK